MPVLQEAFSNTSTTERGNSDVSSDSDTVGRRDILCDDDHWSFLEPE